MRAVLSLILVVTFSGLAVSQQTTFPQRLSTSSNFSKSSQPNGISARHELFGPLDAVGTAPIPAPKFPEQFADHSAAIYAFGDQSEVRAAQFSQQQVQPYYEQASPSRIPGYRETPTRPVRSTYYPSGRKSFDETAFTRQRSTDARESFQPSRCDLGPNNCKSLCGCNDEWYGFCPCKDLDYECRCSQFPGSNFYRDRRKCRWFNERKTDVCDCSRFPGRLGARGRPSACDCSSECDCSRARGRSSDRSRLRDRNRSNECDSSNDCGCGCERGCERRRDRLDRRPIREMKSRREPHDYTSAKPIPVSHRYADAQQENQQLTAGRINSTIQASANIPSRDYR